MISVINYQQAYIFFLSSIKQYYPAFFQTPIVSAHLEIHRLKIVMPSKESGSSQPSWGRRALRWLWPEVCHRPTVKSWNDKEILGKENVVSICFNMFQRFVKSENPKPRFCCSHEIYMKMSGFNFPWQTNPLNLLLDDIDWYCIFMNLCLFCVRVARLMYLSIDLWIYLLIYTYMCI